MSSFGDSSNIQLGMGVEVQNAVNDVKNFGARAKQEVQNVNNELSKTAVNVKGQLTPSLGQSSMMLTDMGRIVQDLPYGIRGVGNNITFIVERMKAMQSQGIGIKEQFKGMLTMLGTGPGAMLTLLNVGITLWTVLANRTSEAATQAERFRDLLKDGEIPAEKIYEEVNRIKTRLEEIANPTFWERVSFGALAALGLSAGEIEKQIKEYRQLQEDLGLVNNVIKEQNRISQIAGELIGKNEAQVLDVVKANQLTSEELRKINEWLGEEIKKFPVLSAGYNEIKSAMDAINEITKSHNEKTKEQKSLLDQLILSDEELLKKIKDIDKALQNPLLKEREINLLLQQRKQLMSELVDDFRLIEKIIDQDIKEAVESIDFDLLDISGKSIATTPISFNSQRAGMTEELKERTEMIKEQSDYVSELGNVTASVGERMLDTWGNLPIILRRNNSLLQQFTNQLGAALLKALALKAALFIGGLITNFFGGGIPAIAALANPAGGPSNPISLGGGGNLGSTPITSRSSTISNIIPVAVSVDGRIRGRDIYMANRNENNLRSKFT